jgi:hypothetical protein
MNHFIDLKLVGWCKRLTCTKYFFLSFLDGCNIILHFIFHRNRFELNLFICLLKSKKYSFNKLVNSQLRCKFDQPILGEYYSYENGLETHTSFKKNGDIDRLFYRRQSGLGATANIITILDNHALGECFILNWRSNPSQHISKHHYELIYRDKSV